MTDRDASPIDQIFHILREHGARRYGQEQVSQLDHALQCAQLAQQNGSSDSLIAAALLHDIGHLVEDGDEGLAAKGIDAKHERRGELYLTSWFGPDVTEPVRLHVESKRYLCWAEAGYFDSLSPASVQSLMVQGGPFSAKEAADFLNRPYAEDAVKLRRWDEGAKDPEASPPALEAFRPHLEACLRS